VTIALGTSLKIRSMIYIAAEPIPFFWPMRTFIHHNPLHGLENMSFADAVEKADKLFHGRTFLPRKIYQQYLAAGKINRSAVEVTIENFVKTKDQIEGIDLTKWLMFLLTEMELPFVLTNTVADADDVHAVMSGNSVRPGTEIDINLLEERLREKLLGDRLVYEVVDTLFGTDIANELDELVIKSCLDFFDEGQSVWEMPGREQGFFTAWRDVAKRNLRFFLRGFHISRILEMADTPEGIIAYVMQQLGIPEDQWMDYFTRELSRLHGWVGFIRWRTSAKHYYWAEQYPGDLIDYMAIRLTLALALLNSRKMKRFAHTVDAIEETIQSKTVEAYLRHELYGKGILPAMAHRVSGVLEAGNEKQLESVFYQYIAAKRDDEARHQAARFEKLAKLSDNSDALKQLGAHDIARLQDIILDFEQQEGMLWLRAMESKAIGRLMNGLTPVSQDQDSQPKRPFAQAMFCIDTRSERIRRHLETIGDYQTFGIAGFFGVPVSFMELGKGGETHLCPVILTPKNLVPEITAAAPQEDAAIPVLERALHELKESVLTPFVTVEAIGLLFGFDMVGKTIAPQTYNRWRRHMHAEKPSTRLLLDKLSREQADSIVRAVQRAVIVKAVQHEFGLEPEKITDDIVRDLREAALGHQPAAGIFAESLNLADEQAYAFVGRLQGVYRINGDFAHRQIEQLGRIGFTLDEQVTYVGTALRTIGLTQNFSRFVLLVGHGSTSENNPYESALDCGACGGNHGLVSGRVLAQMANKPQVRRLLSEQGIDIPDDTWFLPALHNTTTDELRLHDLELIPPSHLVYIDRLGNGLVAASRLCAQERVPSLSIDLDPEMDTDTAFSLAQRNSMDWSQVRPEWGLSRNAFFVIGRRSLTEQLSLDGRAFLHSYDYRVDPKRRLLENILTGPLVVGQWINMEHYFSTVDNDRFGSGSKVYHNVAGRFGVMTGNLSDLRTGLPSQTVLKDGLPYHKPLRLITVIEAPVEHAKQAIEGVVAVKRLVHNGWLRMIVIDPDTKNVSLYARGRWREVELPIDEYSSSEELLAS
jgi:uncharacterized protein YbcC (UPF0753/DUF2309 family)